LPLSFAILRTDGAVTLFIDRRKLMPGLDRQLGNAVTIEPPDRFGAALDALAGEGGTVQVDPASAAAWVFDRLARPRGRVQRRARPGPPPKAGQDETEPAGH